MSIFKKSAVALAIAGAFALTTPSMAATLTGPGPKGEAAQVVYYTVASGAVDTGATAYALTFAPSDNLTGRTTGFGVRVTLPAGVKFVGAPTVGHGADVTSATVASGTGTNQIVINVVPAAGGLVADGVAPVLTLSAVQLTGATALATVGGSISVSAVTFDSGTATVLNTATGTLIESANPFVATVTPANNASRIDVGASGAGNTNNIAKSVFSIGGGINGADQTFFDAGTLNLDSTATLLDASTGANYVLDTANDTFDTTLAGSFTAFRAAGASVSLQAAACGVAPDAQAVAGTVSADGSKVTFAGYTLDSTAALPPAVVPVTLNVCFIANGKVAIAASPVAVSTTLTSAVTSVTTAAQAGNVDALKYNGSSVDVTTFNPGGNTTQQSFLRVVNGGDIDGLVTITGVDDAGNAGSPVTFNLNAGNSMQLNSDDLQNGNTAKGLTGALGSSVGKWRLNVTGEFNGMAVQSLVRNNNSGTVSNLSSDIK